MSDKRELADKTTDIIEYNGLMVHESNWFITAKYRSSLLENLIMTFAQTRIHIENGCPKAVIHPAELKKILGNNDTNIYKKLKKAAINMVGHIVAIEDGSGNFKTFSMITNADYINGEFIILFNREMRPYVHNLRSNFTTLEFATLAHMDNNYSFRIYRLFKKEMYRSQSEVNNGVVVKEYGLNELRCTLGLVDLNEEAVRRAIDAGKSWDDIYENIAKERQFAVWYDFKRKVLEVAKKELKEKTDIRFEYEDMRSGYGGAVKKLRFFIYPNYVKMDMIDELKKSASTVEEVNKEYEQMSFDFNNAIPKVLECYIGHNNLTEKDIQLLYDTAGHNPEKVSDAITLADRQSYIKNYVGWLVSCIKDGYQAATSTIMGDADRAKRADNLKEKIHEDETSIALNTWKRIKAKDDYLQFISYCENKGVSEKTLEVVYDVKDLIDMYVSWKTTGK